MAEPTKSQTENLTIRNDAQKMLTHVRGTLALAAQALALPLQPTALVHFTAAERADLENASDFLNKLCAGVDRLASNIAEKNILLVAQFIEASTGQSKLTTKLNPSEN